MVKAKKYRNGSVTHITCRLCNGSHPLRFCNKFLDFDLEDRLRAVAEHHYCSACLSHNHTWRVCTSKGRCKECGDMHHSLLHENDREGSSQARRQRKNRSGPRSSVTNARGPRSSHASRLRETARSGRRPRPSQSAIGPRPSASAGTLPQAIALQPLVAILPTAIVKIVADNRIFRVKAVIDAGVPHSKISAYLVERLGLKTSILADRLMCSFLLKGTNGSSDSLELVARVGQSFAVLTPTRTLDARIHEKLAGLVLADRNFHISTKVELTLGMDVYARIVRNGLVKCGDQLAAQYSIFGYWVSGMCPL